MGFNCWENVLHSRSTSFYQVLGCAVWGKGEMREKRPLEAPALEQMVWWKPRGLRWASEDMGGRARGMGTGRRRLEL